MNKFEEECTIQSTRDIVEQPNISKVTQGSKIGLASKQRSNKNLSTTQTIITALTNSTYESVSGTKYTIYTQQNTQKDENLKFQSKSQKSVLSSKEQDQVVSILSKNDQASSDGSKNQNNDIQIETNSMVSNQSRSQQDYITLELKAKWVFTRLIEMTIQEFTYQDVLDTLIDNQHIQCLNKQSFLQYLVDKSFYQSQLRQQEIVIDIENNNQKVNEQNKFNQVLAIKQYLKQIQMNQGDEKIPDIENSLIQDSKNKNEQVIELSEFQANNPINFKNCFQNRQMRNNSRVQTKNYFLSEAEGGVTCDICCLSYQKEYFYNLDLCNHSFCKSCTLQYLENCINTSQVLQIKCPDENCTAQFTDQILQKILDTKTFQKYQKFKELKIINSDPTLKWCNRPGCTFYCKTSQSDPKIICKCGHEMCFQCGNNWHEGKTCDEVIQEEFQGAVQKFIISFCPTCKSRVQKASGCNRIHCPICSKHFCWICRTPDISYAHFSHLNILGCPGKQFSRSNPVENPNYQKIVLFVPRLFIFILITAGMIVFMPLFLVCLAIFTPNYLYWNIDEQKYVIPQKQKFLKSLGISILLIFFGIILFPICLIPGSCIVFYQIVKSRL